MALGRGTHTPADHAADDEADDEAEPEQPDTGPEAGQESAPAAAGPVPPGPVAGPPAAGPETGPVTGPPVTGPPAAGPETVPPGPADGQPAAGPHRHRRWVTASLIALIIIVLVAAGGGVAALLTHGFHGKTTVKYRQAAIFSVRTGDCIDLTASGSTVHVVACANPHDAEVFGTFRLSGDWPGDSSARQQASAGCESQLSGYINPQLATSGLTQSYVYPGQQAWAAGQRTVVCEVRSTSGQLTGSVRRG
jgi:Septum formation